MTHRAKLYHVKIHKLGKGEDIQLLGNVDGHGTSAAKIIKDGLRKLDATNNENTIHISYESSMQDIDGDQVGVTLLRGNSGITSTIKEKNKIVLQRHQDHTESVRAGVLFALPRAKDRGVAALHIPHGMGYKSILENELKKDFRKFNLLITLAPIVPIDAFHQAVRQGHITKLTLTKYDVSDSDLFSQYAELDNSNTSRMKLVFEPKRKNWLRHDPIERFVNNPTDETRQQLLEFSSLQFEEAHITVKLVNNITRTFNIENVEGGHPMSIDLNIKELQDSQINSNLGAIRDDLFKELKGAIRSVSSNLISESNMNK